jgi:hypothetical protein
MTAFGFPVVPDVNTNAAQLPGGGLGFRVKDVYYEVLRFVVSDLLGFRVLGWKGKSLV